MKNSEQSAFPEIKTTQSGDGKIPLVYSNGGLTKREYLAGIALQGILSNAEPDTIRDTKTMVGYCIVVADELLKQLEK